jgi:hypothetical protein
MPNLYVTPTEIKAAAPESIRATTTSYDDILLTLVGRVSRLVDKYCRRVFYPYIDTRYFNGNGKAEMWISDLLSINSIEYSEDNGETYTALTVSDYYATAAGDYNSKKSYSVLIVSKLSDTISVWPKGQRSIKIDGVWAYADDRDDAWEDSLDEVEDNPLSDSATSITVNDADGADLWGKAPRFQAGQILQIGSEILEISAADAEQNKLTVIRGRNGSTAAEQTQNTAISIWRPPKPVEQACIIQTVRTFERGTQGFSDTRANPEIGQMMWLKRLDPEVETLLMGYKIREFK